MTEKEQLKQDLKGLRDNNYTLLNANATLEYTDRMLQHIGDPNPELRDDLIYEAFSEWICEKEYYSGEELLHLLDILLDDRHLFYCIGQEEDETVFTRSFSVLAIVLILTRHREKTLLNEDAFLRVKDCLIRYYRQEKDFRGYLDGAGWAHAAAHGSDALEALVQCKEMDDTMLQELLDSVKAVLYNGKYLFCNEEDERIARMIYRILQNSSLSCRRILEWIGGLSECCGWEKTRKQYVARVNAKNLIRCLYFRLEYKNEMDDVKGALLETERKLNRFASFQ
jgi:hypothetical protein